MNNQQRVHPSADFSAMAQHERFVPRRPLKGTSLPTSYQIRSKRSEQHHSIQTRDFHRTTTKSHYSEEERSISDDDDESSLTSSSTSTSRRKSRLNRNNQIFERRRDQKKIQLMIDQGFSLQVGGGRGENGIFHIQDDCSIVSSLSGYDTDYSTSSGSVNCGSSLDDRLSEDKQLWNHPIVYNCDVISSCSSSAESIITEKMRGSRAIEK